MKTLDGFRNLFHKDMRFLKSNEKRCILKLFFMLFVFGIMGVIAFWIFSPKSATIYLECGAKQAKFALFSDQQVAYDIKSDDCYNGKIVFMADKTETMYAVNTSVPTEMVQQIQEKGFPDWESSNVVFPFIDGSATLSSGPFMRIMLERAEGGSFIYDMEITRDEGDGSGNWNRIELTNFSDDLIVLMDSTCDINMKGNTKTMPTGMYQIIGCSSIAFYAVPETNDSNSMDILFGYGLSGSIDHFKFLGLEKGTFELTYFAETEFKEIGHSEVEGTAKKPWQMQLEISDIGRYPIPIKIRGQVAPLKIEDEIYGPSLGQWLVDEWKELLLSVITFFFGWAIGRCERKEGESGKAD